MHQSQTRTIHLYMLDDSFGIAHIDGDSHFTNQSRWYVVMASKGLWINATLSFHLIILHNDIPKEVFLCNKHNVNQHITYKQIQLQPTPTKPSFTITQFSRIKHTIQQLKPYTTSVLPWPRRPAKKMLLTIIKTLICTSQPAFTRDFKPDHIPANTITTIHAPHLQMNQKIITWQLTQGLFNFSREGKKV